MLWPTLSRADNACTDPIAQAQRVKSALSELLKLDLEQLINLPVTSLKNAQAYAKTPASVFIVTHDDIRRSGASTIPEVLRYVPGLHVARIDGNKWAISARGLNERFANKLLVMIDGRSIYNNFFGGVYWEDKDVFLDDVERIEIIRGPGASLYGANAVNGVINIITKTAQDSGPNQVTFRTGTRDKVTVSARRIVKLGTDTCGRFSIKYADRDDTTSDDNVDLADGSEVRRFSFRVDQLWDQKNTFTLQGDIYDNSIGQSQTNIFEAPFAPIADFNADNRGHNVLFRWQHEVAYNESTTLQLYIDQYEQDSQEVGRQTITTYDVDFDHKIHLGDRHSIIWGVGFRLIEDSYTNTFTQTLNPDSRSDQVYSIFLQDDITLIPDTLHVIVGTKFESNDYSGFEYQPSVRLSWNINPKQTLWSAVSRSVRVPTRAEHDLLAVSDVIQPNAVIPFTQVLIFEGNTKFDAEQLLSFEVGYRNQLTRHFLLDIATFYNRYHDLRTIEGGDFVFSNDPFLHIEGFNSIDNLADAVIYGVEMAADWRVTPDWRVTASYSYADVHLHIQDRSQDVFSVNSVDSAPRNQVFMRSAYDINVQWELDAGIRYVDALTTLDVDSYVTVDVRTAWKPNKNMTFSLIVNNLFDQRYEEFRQVSFGLLGSEEERQVHGKMSWRY